MTVLFSVQNIFLSLARLSSNNHRLNFQRRASVPRQTGDKKAWKHSDKSERSEARKSSSRSDVKRRDSIKSSSSQSDIRRTSSSKSVPPGKEVQASPHEFLAKVTCWQQRIDPESDVSLNRKRKQRPVSIAGDAETLNLKHSGNCLKRTPSMGSLVIAEDGVILCTACCTFYVAVSLSLSLLNIFLLGLLNKTASTDCVKPPGCY